MNQLYKFEKLWYNDLAETNYLKGGRLEMTMKFTLKINSLAISYIKNSISDCNEIEKLFWEVASVCKGKSSIGKKFLNKHCQLVAEKVG